MKNNLDIRDEGVILRGEHPHEASAVLNPTCINVGATMHMFYRAIDVNMISTIGYARFEQGVLVSRSAEPVLRPEFEYESKGLEDPRIVRLEDTYYLFYTAYDGITARIAYAVSVDLINWEKRGCISPNIPYQTFQSMIQGQELHPGYLHYAEKIQKACGPDVAVWDKDGFIFPERIDGKIVFIHRIMPGIQVALVDSLDELTDEYWQKYILDLKSHIIIDPEYSHEGKKVGGGCPPIKTDFGWLGIYHSVSFDQITQQKTYHACAVLLDIHNPKKVIYRLPEPLFSPSAPWEKEGLVDNVVFPTGVNIDGDRIYVYYGAADKIIGAKSLSLSGLLDNLVNHA